MEIGGISFGGLASGIDTKALISAIIGAERQPIQRLESRRSVLEQQKDALDEMRSKLNGLISTLKDLKVSGVFDGRTTSVSDETILTASAAPGAEQGVFSIEVTSLAAANKIRSDGFSASDTALVADGTITIQSGENDEISIDVSAAAGNNSLESIRDAINVADAGVQASVLFDGSQYYLTVRSEETGLDNALTVSDSTSLNLTDPTNEITAAADARIEVDGLVVTSATNRVSNVISGVTLDLLSTTGAEPITVQVGEDIDGVIEGINELTDAYNEAIRFFNQQFDRDNPGPLGTNGFARRQMLRLQSAITSGVDGIPFGEIRSLASLGVSFDSKTGELSVDNGKLRELLEERFDDVGALFQTSTAASDPRIQFLSQTAATVQGDYAVQITQAAEQASVVGSTAIKQQGLKNDETLTITIGPDTVQADLLKNMKIQDVVDTVNAALAAGGIDATATDDGGKLRITTSAYGSDVSISVTSDLNDVGNGLQSGFDDTPSVDDGLDVAGTIGGFAATGAGQVLTGDAGTDVEGLSLLVTATAADVAATGGDFGTVTFSPGLADRVIDDFTGVTRFGDGQIDSSQDVLDDQLERISDEITRIEERLVRREALLVRTFSAAEQAISLLQSQQSQLGSFFPF